MRPTDTQLPPDRVIAAAQPPQSLYLNISGYLYLPNLKDYFDFSKKIKIEFIVVFILFL